MPIRVACDVCNKEYNLKDEFAGRKLKCAACGNILGVPEAVAVLEVRREAEDADLDPIFGRDKFLLRQKYLTVHERYEVWDEDGQSILFVERPRHWGRNLAAICLGILTFFVVGGGSIAAAFSLFEKNEEVAIALAILGGLLGLVACVAVILAIAPKRHIGFYADQSRTDPLLIIEQDHKFTPVNATYTCRDADGNVLGRFRKNYLYNFIRKRWYCYGPDGELLAVAKEDSIILSLLRRTVGEYLYLLGLMRTNFIILRPDHETLLGEFNRKFTLLDRYVLDLSEDREGYLDRRLAIALGVLLDTGEHR